MTELIIQCLSGVVTGLIIIWAIATAVYFERTEKKPIAQFNKVSLQQFREDYKNTVGIPEDCEDAMYITDEIYENIKLPTRTTKGSAGYDFYSPIDFDLLPNQSITFPTGICAEIEDNWVLMIYPRSGLGFKTGVRLANTVGVIDSDFSSSDNEGHIMMKFVNHGGGIMKVKAGDRIAQGVFVPYGITYDDNTVRERNGGLGSSGK